MAAEGFRGREGGRFLDAWTLFVTAFLVGLSGAAAPGPLTTVAIREASRAGFWRGWSVSLGHALPEFLLVVGLAMGLNRWLEAPPVVGTLGLAGGLVLLWMGRGIMLEARGAELPSASAAGPDAGRGAFWSGAGATLSNPYWFLWWATVGAGYVALSRSGGWGAVMIFFCGHILADIGWLGLVSGLVATGRRLMTPGFYRGLLWCLGAFLMAFGVYFLWSGWRFFASVL